VDQDDDQRMNDPDWDRFIMKAPGTSAPVGDPTRWGAQIFQALDDNVPLLSTPQILQVSTRDGYARSWSLEGTLSLPTLTWNTADVIVQLEITMGVGQVQITHAVLLFNPAINTPPTGLPAAPRGGLCLNQYFFYGGPYNAIGEANPGGVLANQARAFAIIGGLIGQSISIRATYQLQGATATGLPPTPGLPAISRLALIVTPYAAGEGL
jgi:hypothetical protein